MTKTLITWWLEKKVVKWQKFKSALCNLTQKLLLLNFVSMQFLTEISNQSGSQIHSWILLKKNLLCQNLFYFFRASPFHSEWLPLINILMIETFSPKANQNLSRLWPIEVIHGEKDLPCKKLNKFWYNIIFFSRGFIHGLGFQNDLKIWLSNEVRHNQFFCQITKFTFIFCHLTSFAKGGYHLQDKS